MMQALIERRLSVEQADAAFAYNASKRFRVKELLWLKKSHF
jgi:hypothetical protein